MPRLRWAGCLGTLLGWAAARSWHVELAPQRVSFERVPLLAGSLPAETLVWVISGSPQAAC